MTKREEKNKNGRAKYFMKNLVDYPKINKILCDDFEWNVAIRLIKEFPHERLIVIWRMENKTDSEKIKPFYLDKKDVTIANIEKFILTREPDTTKLFFAKKEKSLHKRTKYL